MNAPAFAQQSSDDDQPNQILLHEELFGEQILNLGDPIEPFLDQEPFEQQHSVQQTPIQQLSFDYEGGQDIFDLIWTRQPFPGPIVMEDVALQPTLMQQQGQMPVPQFPGATGLAPCHLSASNATLPSTVPPAELPPAFELCVRCNETFEVARNRGTACYFHRGKVLHPSTTLMS